MKNINYTLLFIMLLIGMGIGSYWGNNSRQLEKDLKEAKETITLQETQIDRLELALSESQKIDEQLIVESDSITKDYEIKRNSKDNNTKALQNSLIAKGKKDFGSVGINNKETTALLYGNQYADLYRLQKRRLENQKVQLIAYRGIVEHKDVIISTQNGLLLKYVDRKDKVKTKLGWFGAGYILGILTPL